LLSENLLTQFVQNIGHVVVRITFRDEVDARFPNQFEEGKITAAGIDCVELIQKRFFGFDHDRGAIQHEHP